MTIDDIYTACVEQNIDELDRMLSNEEERYFLNELIKTKEDEDGDSSSFSLAFSVIVNMKNSNKISVRVLETLTKYGMDLNVPVTIYYSNGIIDEYPISKYILDNPDLLELMLKCGADPNGIEYITRGKLKEEDSILFWAIRDKHFRSISILLKYGADPNLCVKPIIMDYQLMQEIPPMYYSIVENNDLSTTIELIKYGANPNIVTDFSVVKGGKISLYYFLKRNKEWNYILEEAYRQISYHTQVTGVVISRKIDNNGLISFEYSQNGNKTICLIEKNKQGVQAKEYKTDMYYQYPKALFWDEEVLKKWDEVTELTKRIYIRDSISSAKIKIAQGLSKASYNYGIVDEYIAWDRYGKSKSACFSIINYDHVDDFLRFTFLEHYSEEYGQWYLTLYKTGHSKNYRNYNALYGNIESSLDIVDALVGSVGIMTNKTTLEQEETYYLDTILIISEIFGIEIRGTVK